MVKNSKFDFSARLQELELLGAISSQIARQLAQFYESCAQAISSAGEDPSPYARIFSTYLDLILEESKTPYPFEPYHKRVRAPFDYYSWGIEFMRPLVDADHSHLLGKEHLVEIQGHLEQGHNVVFFANHQIEADPQAISLLLEKEFPKLAEEMIFVAGERVTTDPLAIPFSLGRELLCIYSKRYIDHPPEEKHRKQLHNKKTMQLMSALLTEGGRCIYVAPSGGRDRPNKEGVVEVAPFDPNSVEMFHLMAKRAKTPTFFYPLALATYQVLPPPETIQVELGESRVTKRGPIHMSVGPCIDMDAIPVEKNIKKDAARKARADYIWDLVRKDYARLTEID
jgi:glycerol-3-phosphate O-acyltransferase